MNIILLNNGMVALVDEEDYERLNKYNWSALKGTSTYYAIRSYIDESGKKRLIQMHREIMNLTDKKIFCDHIDFNGLNNLKANLRTATASQNSSYRRSINGSSSKYIGVSWFKKTKCWCAKIKKNGKVNNLGYFINEVNAANAYNKAAIKLHGKFANLNQIDTNNLPQEPTTSRQSPRKNSSSKYLGVCRRKEGKPYEANITIRGKQKYLGSFLTELEAATAYNNAAVKIHGQFANLNILN